MSSAEVFISKATAVAFTAPEAYHEYLKFGGAAEERLSLLRKLSQDELNATAAEWQAIIKLANNHWKQYPVMTKNDNETTFARKVEKFELKLSEIMNKLSPIKNHMKNVRFREAALRRAPDALSPIEEVRNHAYTELTIWSAFITK